MKKLLSILFVASLAFVSCNDDETQSFDESPYLVGFNTDSKSASYVVDGQDYDLNVPVSLLGGQTGNPVSSDVTVSYMFNADESTAVLGNEFDFVNAGNSAVIMADEFTANIPMVIHTTNMGTGVENAKTIVLDLVETDNASVVVASQYKQIVITLYGLCYSANQGMYDLTVTALDSGSVYPMPDEEIFATDQSGYYLTNSTGPYNARGLFGSGAQLSSSTPGFYYTEVCGAITMETQNLAGVYSNIVTQSAAQAAASMVADDGTITIEYSVWFTNNTVERPYRGVYTPQ